MEILFKKILVVSDNATLIKSFSEIIKPYEQNLTVTYSCSPINQFFLSHKTFKPQVTPLNVKEKWVEIYSNYDLVLSLHCKQLFPAEMVKAVKCINVHPGCNPYNRGWFPQVFSILNNLPFGATIHEIDEQLDHGAIIARREVVGEIWETSIDIYNKIIKAEIELLEEFLPTILSNTYKTFLPEVEGNVNLKKDFNALCELNLNEQVTMGEAINRLRALTHGEYKNAWFAHPETGEKIYVSINLERIKKRE
jgi:methionyl-tRNA formyltransferase